MNDFNLTAILSNPEYSAILSKGVILTLVVAACSWALAMLLATLLLTLRLSAYRWAQQLVAGYVAYHRNVPTLVQLMLWYFGISSLLPDAVQTWLSSHNAEALFATLSLGLCQAAYFSEDLRSGLRAIPSGQSEAARALGHSYLGSMRHVIIPQAVRNALPALINHSVSLFKNSSLAMAIGVAELTHAVKEVESQSFLTFESYFIATILYLGMSLIIMGFGVLLTRRLNIAGAR